MLITIKGVELVHLSFKNCWEEVRATDYAGISLVSNSSVSFANNIISKAEICNNWLEILCIIVDGLLRTKIMRALKLSGKFSGYPIISR